jgi:hypothetical protein
VRVLSRSAGQQGAAGDRAGHAQDRAQRDQEQDEHRQAEADRQQAPAPQQAQPVAEAQAATLQRDRAQLHRQEPARDAGPQHRDHRLPDQRHEAEHEQPHAESGGQRHQEEAVAQRAADAPPPPPGLRHVGHPALARVDPGRDDLVERLSDRDRQRRVRHQRHPQRADGDHHPDHQAQRVAVGLVPAAGERGQRGDDGGQLHDQPAQQRQQHDEREQRGQQADRPQAGARDEDAQAPDQAPDAVEQLSHRGAQPTESRPPRSTAA